MHRAIFFSSLEKLALLQERAFPYRAGRKVEDSVPKLKFLTFFHTKLPFRTREEFLTAYVRPLSFILSPLLCGLVTPQRFLIVLFARNNLQIEIRLMDRTFYVTLTYASISDPFVCNYLWQIFRLTPSSCLKRALRQLASKVETKIEDFGLITVRRSFWKCRTSPNNLSQML